MTLVFTIEIRMYVTEKTLTVACLGTLAAVVVIWYMKNRERQNIQDIRVMQDRLETLEKARLGVFNRDYNYSDQDDTPGGEWDTPRSLTWGQTRWLPTTGMDAQYQNRSVNMTDRHPVLAYQLAHSMDGEGIVPASIGDALRTPDIGGPVGSYNPLMIRPNAPVPGRYGALTPGVSGYGSFGSGSSGPGPSPGDPRGMGVPVPSGSLKFYNERYNPDQFKLPNPHFPPGGAPPGVYRDPRLAQTQSGELPYYPTGTVDSGDFYKPYGPNANMNVTPFFGSVNSYSPFPEIISPWEKAGILTSRGDILNLFRRPIAPLQDLWEYQVQDKDGFIIKLANRYIEDGDRVNGIIGKEGLGPWTAHIFVQNKYVWV